MFGILLTALDSTSNFLPQLEKIYPQPWVEQTVNHGIEFEIG